MKDISDSQLQKIRDTQRESWNKSSSGWKKWDDIMQPFLKPSGDKIIEMLRLQPTDVILDVATGTGEPGLSIAQLIPGGKVIGTDLSENMVAIANANAAQQGISNFEALCCDVSDLPFPGQDFDGVSCRLGLMFFPDMDIALHEMKYVLKPGGRMALSVWHQPARNSWIALSMSSIIDVMGLQLPGPGAPGLFRCADEQQMIDLFSKHAMDEIRLELVEKSLTFDSFDSYWQFVKELASPIAFKNADESTREQVKNVVQEKIKVLFGHGLIELDSCSIVISGIAS